MKARRTEADKIQKDIARRLHKSLKGQLVGEFNANAVHEALNNALKGFPKKLLEPRIDVQVTPDETDKTLFHFEIKVGL